MILLYVIISLCALPTPQRLIKPGIVVLGSRKCNYTQKIIDRLTAQGKPFTIEYIDNDKELNNYIVDEHKGGIPIVFENGVYQGTGKEYLNKQDGGNSQPVEPVKPQPVETFKAEPVPQPVEPTKPQPVPQPVEPTKPQPAPQPVEPIQPQPVPQPVEPTKPQPVPQPVEPTKPQPVPQPVEPTKPQPVPQPITSQTVAVEPSTPKPIAPPSSPQQPVAPQTILPCVINPVTNPVICKN